MEVPAFLGGSVKVHGAKGILVEFLESLVVSTHEVVNLEHLSGQLVAVFVGRPEEGVSSGVLVGVEPGDGLSTGVLVGIHALPLVEDERALGKVIEGILLSLLLLLTIILLIGSGLLLLLGLLLFLGLLNLGLGVGLLLLFLLGNGNGLGKGDRTLHGEEVGLVDDGGEPAGGVHETSAEGGVEDLNNQCQPLMVLSSLLIVISYQLEQADEGGGDNDISKGQAVAHQIGASGEVGVQDLEDLLDFLTSLLGGL